MMKIAWCFSGQIRVGIECSDAILRFIDNQVFDVDFFIHTWDIETDKLNNNFRTNANKNKLSNFIKIFNPKKYKIDDYDQYQEDNVDKCNLIHYPLYNVPMFQSIYESNELKRKYEIENNFKYDYVIRARPDVIYPIFDSLIEELTYISGKDDFHRTLSDGTLIPFEDIYVNDYWNKLPFSVEDIFWIAKSDTMDKVCNFKRWSIPFNEYVYYDWQRHLCHYITKILNIHVISLKYNELHVCREHEIKQNLILPKFGFKEIKIKKLM